ncbi:MAG: phosphoribosylformylglycinamidine synthase subunit PurS [candidate division Zixibacteria bacterium]|nr:phosphoribosylformylglycinamidine synthase subunit PurS [candidate division Zixibacteria bacterium]
MVTGTVTVRLKPGVLDPQGQAIRRALEQMGFESVHNVRTGRTFEIQLDAPDPASAHGRLTEMSQKLLANPVVETFSVEVKS